MPTPQMRSDFKAAMEHVTSTNAAALQDLKQQFTAQTTALTSQTQTLEAEQKRTAEELAAKEAELKQKETVTYCVVATLLHFYPKT
jgi:hypothetical protein